jgi:transcriptional regulator with XRE-family HTH domain
MGRRAGISSTERDFRKAFATSLRQIIGDRRGAASKAADELRISRQAMSLYLRERATPSAEIIRRACQKWSLSLDVNGNIVSESSFPQEHRGPLSAPPLQLWLLPDALDSLNNENVKVKIARKLSDSVDLEVRIEFGSQLSTGGTTRK